tara:strand:+ start:2459 stop:2821 length:363 start_codon:yes stop_codon:yes gene_type:complete
MKTKNSKIKLKDIHHGLILYIAHPVCGIEKCIVLSKPDKENFVDVVNLYGEDEDYSDKWRVKRSLRDMGVVDHYNWRRTFRKRKQAESYVERIKNDPPFKKYWQKHLKNCQEMEEMFATH